MENSAVEWIEEKVKFEIDIVKMDYNNGVQISMSVFSGMLKKILIEIQQAKGMENQKAHEYAEFAIRCDRIGMKILNFEDWIKLQTFKTK